MTEHVPVLLAESLRYLAPERGGRFVDCTVGLGGHTAALLEQYPEVTVVGLDRDPQALASAGERLAPFGARVTLLPARFDQLEERLAELGVARVSGVLADLGVSSMQLGVAERGFSFLHEGPLDMRMGSGETTAADVLNGFSEDELTRIFKEYGEEKQARRIAREIVGERQEEPLRTTAQLRRVIERVKPVALPGPRSRSRRPQARRRGERPRAIHPATQVFQALRIEVNQELEQLRELLEQSTRMLERDGRLVVISYHSLEDRIVKHRFRELAAGEVDRVTGRTRAETQVIEVLTRRPVRPEEAEVAANPRARSARLRAARRL